MIRNIPDSRFHERRVDILTESLPKNSVSWKRSELEFRHQMIKSRTAMKTINGHDSHVQGLTLRKYSPILRNTLDRNMSYSTPVNCVHTSISLHAHSIDYATSARVEQTNYVMNFP